jgi:hypothetical protein
LNVRHFEGTGLKNHLERHDLLNFMKIYQLIQKLSMGDTQTDKQHDDLISINVLFLKESRLKTEGSK